MTVTVNTGNVYPDSGWTIDELAGFAGVPTRTIREYRTLGVLPAPQRRGRVGVYDGTHLQRLQLISRLQQRGYSLAGIRDLLDAWAEGASLAAVLSSADPDAGALDETPVSMTAAQLGEIIPELADPKDRGAAVQAGLVVEDGDRYAVRSPSLLRLIAEGSQAGVPLPDLLGLVARLRIGAAGQAASVVGLMTDHLWQPGGENEASERLARRGRILLAQAVASLLIDELGAALMAASSTPQGEGLGDLVDHVRIGSVLHRPEEAS